MTADPEPAKYLFYADHWSLFSGKVRPALRFKRLRYEEKPPTPEAYATVIEPRTGYSYIPVLVAPDDRVFQDSSNILDELERRHPEPSIYPATPLQRVVAFLLEVYGDEFLVLPAMHYRWGTPRGEAKARWDFAMGFRDHEAANEFADRMSASLPFLGVTPKTAPAIEAHTHDLLSAMSSHFEHHDYLLGGKMSLADCSLCGSIYAHLYNDEVPGPMLRARYPKVCEWIERMNAPREGGDFLPDDAIAPTLVPILELVGRDAVPLLVGSIDASDEWCDRERGDRAGPPRVQGGYVATLRGVSFDRYVNSYVPWLVARPQEAYDGLDAAGRARVRERLEGTGLLPLLDRRPRHPLVKEGFRLAFRDRAPVSPRT